MQHDDHQSPQSAMQQTDAQFGLEPKKKSRGRFVGFAGIIGVLVLGVAYYTFMYLPNTPENVYRRGIASIGVGLDQLIEDQTFNPTNTNTMEGSFTMSSPFELSVDFDGTSTVSGDGDFSVNAQWDQYDPGFEAYYTLLDSQYPELYFKLSGVEPLINDFLGADFLAMWAEDESLEDIWWQLNFEELTSLGLISEEELEELTIQQDTTITATDYQKLMQAFINASNQHLFTANVDDMVLQRVEDLGTEEYEGVASNKYLVEVNRQNLKSYLMLLRDEVVASGVVEKVLPEYNLQDSLSDSMIGEAVDGLVLDDVRIEAWVGLNNKVLRNIRFTPTENDSANNYLDVSLLLDDANLDVIPLRIKAVQDDEHTKGHMTLNLISNLADNSFEIVVDLDSDAKSEFYDDYRMAMNVKMTGLDEAPLFEQPINARSFIDFLFDEPEGASFNQTPSSFQAQSF